MKIADKDIICYKVVETRNKKLWTLLLFSLGVLKDYNTMFMETPIRVGETVIGVPELTEEMASDAGRFYSIGEGFIHSYASKSPCLAYKYKPYRAIIECIIPKGTPYYVGHHQGVLGYASTRLTYVKVIE